MKYSSGQPATSGYLVIITVLFALGIQGCTGVNSFPTAARPGDTIAVMVGGSEKTNKFTIDASLLDANGTSWDLKSLGLVRSVFNLRPDGRANGLNYASHLDSIISWSKGHEPVQTVLVVDIPAAAATGMGTLEISTNVDDNSSLINDPIAINVELLPGGTGAADEFSRQDPFTGSVPANFSDLEPAPHVKVDICDTGADIGAITLVVDFDETLINPGDINVYTPEAIVRGTALETGSFGETQRMVYWKQDGDKLTISTIAPQGLDCQYLQHFIMYPTGISPAPSFALESTTSFDINGETVSLPGPVTLTQHP